MKSSTEFDAARYALLLQDPEVGFDEINRALDWIHHTPENRAAFERAMRFLEVCENVLIEPAQIASLSAPVRPISGFNRLRSWPSAHPIAASLIAMFGVVALLVGGYLLRLSTMHTLTTAQFASAVGEIRNIRLPDGSTVTLAGGSAVAISFGDNLRQIALKDGEALFTVARDPHRPLVVDAGNGSIMAVGTAFNVHRDRSGATVTVVHGEVEVLLKAQGHQSRTRLGREMQVTYFDDGDARPIRHVDPQAILAWQKGQLHFSGQALGIVIDDLNRYSPKPIIIEGPNVDWIPVTGTMNVGGIPEWLRGLASVTGIEVVESVNSIRLKAHSEPFRARPISLPTPSDSWAPLSPPPTRRLKSASV